MTKKTQSMPDQIPPLPLKKGGTIGVFAPSSWVDPEDIEKSSQYVESLGYNVFIHPQTYEREHQSAGTILQKAMAFQGLWQRKDIDAIWIAGGGNRCLHLLSALNLEALKRAEPKPVIGFSDATALLNTLHAHTSIITFHGPVFKNLHKHNPEQLNHLFTLLEGEKNTSYLIKKDNIIKEGKASGRLIGGNLSIFQYLPQIWINDICDNAIIFLEDCNEEISRIDRTFTYLRQLGIFKKCAALLLGEFSNLKDTGRPYGYTLKDIILEHTENLDIPVLCNMPFGHGKNLYSFPIGASATLDTDTCIFKLESHPTR